MKARYLKTGAMEDEMAVRGGGATIARSVKTGTMEERGCADQGYGIQDCERMLYENQGSKGQVC
jgi:hypothetical protein